MWLVAMIPAGCDAAALDSGDSPARESAEASDTGCPCESGECGPATTGWTTRGVCIAPLGSRSEDRYYFGMAETGGAEGWYGEDCVPGPGPGSDTDVCHQLVGCEPLCLETVHDPDEVVASETTLFTDTIASAGNITYVIGDGTDCWTWGHSMAYYEDALGCAGRNW